GSGKSVTSMAIMRLTDYTSGRIATGQILFRDSADREVDLTTASDEQMRAIRGNDIAMIFQEPMTSLNPVFTVGDQIVEAIMLHQQLSRSAARDSACKLLEKVRLPDAEQMLDRYPHQLSGGMRQRVVIAMALVMNPALVIADEPTTALDVTIQAQILELLRDLQHRFGTSILLITHDLGVVAETASRVIVMYGGEIVEEAPVRELFANAHHPYTEGLLSAMPQVGQERERLTTIPGSVPPPTSWPVGCRFHDRCPYAWDRCTAEHPPLYQIGTGHVSRCHLAEEPQRRANKRQLLEARKA
ncbi:MAG TPA: ABC transporter ATP-binding protein, partial [Gemmatimonadaceae bacterium]